MASSAELAVVHSCIGANRSLRMEVISGSSSTMRIRDLTSANIMWTPKFWNKRSYLAAAESLNRGGSVSRASGEFQLLVPHLRDRPSILQDFYGVWQTSFYPRLSCWI